MNGSRNIRTNERLKKKIQGSTDQIFEVKKYDVKNTIGFQNDFGKSEI